MVTLVPAGPAAPPGLEAMLRELGDGEAGFSGTPFGRGEQPLAEFLAECMAREDGSRVPAGWVPATTFWIVESGTVVGMLRMRHCLNEALRIKGGHIGYYVSPRARGRGIAREALGLALREIARLGEKRILLTTSPDNTGSIRVIEANGGRLTAQVPDPEGGTVSQYWIELA